MANKIAILTDSSSSLDFMNIPYDCIYQVRHTVIFKDQEYVDGIDITKEEFYRRISEEDIIPTTSQPSIGQIAEMCDSLAEKGYTEVIFLPISKGISGTYDSIKGSLDLIKSVLFHVVDTKATAVHLGYMVLEAGRLCSLGKSAEEIISYVEFLRDRLKLYFMVDDLKFLVKNGRLSNASGFLATMLKIKPVLEFDDYGRIIGTEKIRTTKKTMETIIGHVMDATKNAKHVQYTVCHGMDLDLFNKFKEEMKRIGDTDKFLILPLPPVIGAHVGNGVVSIGYFILD